MINEKPLDDIAYDLAVCRRVLSGEMSIFDAAYEIVYNHHNDDPWAKDIPETEVLYDIVDEVEMETPKESTRQHCNTDALARKLERRKQLIFEVEQRYRSESMKAFQAIIDCWQPWLGRQQKRN